MKKTDRKNQKLSIIFIILLLSVSITGCEIDLFGGDPIDEKTINWLESDELIEIESIVVGTVKSIDQDNLIILIDTGVELECTLPSDETIEVGDIIQIVTIFSGYMDKNEWMLTEIIFDEKIL